ncbi:MULTISPECIES: metallophosphoesterase [Metabacillus]|uniref:Metallophosphoesterase n=1 Tax=Metabacillus hrfriensis TaxID=3048891 RepID=A0ACD4RGE9_9BACI|nr:MULTISPECIES: metallophosphoesterase [Metabacillus]UAL53996.1 metallophosphoesterase [Metabacillus dongyingensis]USK30312.1 metallophosphoesterase [Bacillus sp. CMF21]WHZ59561.1 metallophosphoesterase [Metabacillus sp. CT-WN-B3]
MTKDITRRAFLKGLFASLAGALLAAFGGYGYARYIEPRLIHTTEIEISSTKLPSSFSGVKIVQFSDTHLSEDYSINQLEKIVNKINLLSPDVIFFTGDLIDKPNQYAYLHQISPVLGRLKAPLGKYAIYGNHDHGGYGTSVYETIMKDSNFNLLKNRGERISLLDGSSVFVAGIDDMMLGRPDFDQTFADAGSRLFTILLAHEPDAALEAKQFSVDLQLSGHSHGGQVQLPFYGPLITPPYASVYTEGLYEVDSMKLYVNRGLGTTRLPYRFFSVPEITVFTLIKI